MYIVTAVYFDVNQTSYYLIGRELTSASALVTTHIFFYKRYVNITSKCSQDGDGITARGKREAANPCCVPSQKMVVYK